MSEETFRPAVEVFQDDLDFLARRGAVDNEDGDNVHKISVASHLTRQSLYVNFDPLVGNDVDDESKKSSSSVDKATENEGGLLDLGEGQEVDLMAMTSPISCLTQHKAKETPTDTTTSKRRIQPQWSPEERPDLDTLLNEGVAKEGANAKGNKSWSSQGSDHPEEDLADVLDRKSQHITELERIIAANASTLERYEKDIERRRASETEMQAMLKEYEQTMNELILAKEQKRLQDEKQCDDLNSESREIGDHLESVEAAFADVHRKYERNKKVIEGFKENEDTLKNTLNEYEQRLKVADQRFELLKQHAEDTLEQANKEIDVIQQQSDGELARLKALLKKTELRVAMLERSVEQKSRENEQLSTICDDLIAKVGT